MIRGAVRTAFLFVAVLLVGTAAATAAEPLFLWTVQSETATVTMVGSIHVGKPDFFPLPDVFENSFASAGALAVEVDIGNPANIQKTMALMTQKGILPKGETLEGRLGPEVWKRLEEYAAERGITKLGRKGDQKLVAGLSEINAEAVVYPPTVFPAAGEEWR